MITDSCEKPAELIFGIIFWRFRALWATIGCAHGVGMSAVASRGLKVLLSVKIWEFDEKHCIDSIAT